jgi:hypothetical protein
MESAGTRCEETVQARTVGIIDSERMGGGQQGTDLLAALGRARPLVLRNANCQDTYELLSRSNGRNFSSTSKPK